jgi:hypothetical protein
MRRGGGSELVEIVLADDGHPGQKLVLYEAGLDERVAVANGVEGLVHVEPVGDAQEQGAAVAGLEGARREQHAALFQAAQVGSVLVNELRYFVEGAAVAQDGDGVHGREGSTAAGAGGLSKGRSV